MYRCLPAAMCHCYSRVGAVTYPVPQSRKAVLQSTLTPVCWERLQLPVLLVCRSLHTQH